MSVQTELDGAQEDFDGLRSEIVAFGQREPYRLIREHNPDMTEQTYRVEFVERPPTLRWGRLFGSGVQHLRNSLDHLVYAIAIHESGIDPPPDHNVLMFPVLNPPNPFPARRIRSLSGDVRAAIQAEQPDSDHLHDSPLWRLEEFNRSSKHRAVSVAATRIANAALPISGAIPGAQVTVNWRVGSVEDKAPFLTITFDRPQPDVQMQFEGALYVSVRGIGRRGDPANYPPVFETAEALRLDTRGIIARVSSAAGL